MMGFVNYNFLWVAVVAYLFGSIPFGVLVARTYAIDVQKVGSGNTGASNVLRSAGWGPGLVVALADIMKSGVAVLIAHAFGMPDWEVMLVGWCAVIGHNYSIFLGFKGGKGVAASFGTIAFLDIGLGLAILPLFIITVLVTRFTSAASIIASASSVILAIAMQREWWKVLMLGGLALMIAFKHRDNLGRMYAGIERRIDQREPRVVSSDTAKPGSVDNLFKPETGQIEAEQVSISNAQNKPE